MTPRNLRAVTLTLLDYRPTVRRMARSLLAPPLRSSDVVVHGLLDEGVAASTRQDGQAESLGEWLRARHADVPVALLEDGT